MKRDIKILALLASMLTTVAVVACDNNIHEHTFADSWTTDAEHHWKAATCEHTYEVNEKGMHDYVNGVCMVCGYDNNEEENSSTTESSTDETEEDGATEQALFMFAAFGEEGYTVTGVTDASIETLDIPSTHEGLPVLGIDDRAFREMANLKTVVIPETVTFIGAFAFNDCPNIETIYYNAANCADAVGDGNVFSGAGNSEKGIRLIIGATVEKIPDLMFYYQNFRTLRWVEFEENSVCSVIGHAAFTDSLVEELTLPSSIQTIEDDAFSNCTALKKFYFEGTLEEWMLIEVEDEDDCNPIHHADETYINGELFTEANIPSSITEIREGAFMNCSTLKSVNIPSSVTKIGENAFHNCDDLDEVYLDAKWEDDLRYAYGPFAETGGWDGFVLTIGPSVEAIPAKAFYDSSVAELAFDGETTKCKTIGSEAFMSCDLLEKVEIAHGVTKIEDSAFSCCPAIKYVFFNAQLLHEGDERTTPFDNTSNVNGRLEIGNDVKNIPDQLFTSFKNITTLVFVGESKMTIGWQSFMSCLRLQTVTFNDRITQFADEAFRNCSALQSVTIGKSVTAIGGSAFTECPALEEVIFRADACTGMSAAGAFETFLTERDYVGFTLTIGDNVREIPEYSFSGSAVKEVIFEKGSVCKTIGVGAFLACDNLVSCELPLSVTKIAERAFHSTGFKKIHIPASVTSLEPFAFAYCHQIEAIQFDANLMVDYERADSVFYGCGLDAPETCVLTVGANVTRLPDWLFSSTMLTHVVFEQGSVCSQIGANTFSECGKLSEIPTPPAA